MNTRKSFLLAGLCGSLALSAPAATPVPDEEIPAAVPSGKPYATVISRNVFGLVPIPVVDPASLTPSTPPPKITPNGIMTLFGKLQVLFKVQQPAAAGQPAKEVSYTMGVGERQDDIEVQKIDDRAATITFNNHGVVQTLELAKAAAGAPSGAPPTGGTPPGGIPRPGGLPAVISQPGGAATTTIGAGGRFGRNRTGAATTTAGSAGGGAGAGGSQSGTPVNERGIYDPSRTASDLTPEQQILLIEAQRQKYKAEGSPIADILPPTPITKDIQNEEAGGGN